jgi:hypothetical protein
MPRHALASYVINHSEEDFCTEIAGAEQKLVKAAATGSRTGEA